MSDYMRPGMPKSDPSLLRLQLVGPMQAFTLDNESVLPPGRKTRGLLAILAMSGRRPVLRSKLAEMLWSRRSEEQARASLRQEIHRLLDALTPVGAPIVNVERHSLTLRPGLTTVDAERLLNANVNHVLSQASANAQPGPGGIAFPGLDGVLLEELNGTDPALDVWLVSERRRLHEHALGVAAWTGTRRDDCHFPAVASARPPSRGCLARADPRATAPGRPGCGAAECGSLRGPVQPARLRPARPGDQPAAE
jgi:hypothetical protein